MIIDYNGKVRSVGKSQMHHNLYPVDSVLIKGEPLRVITHRVDMKGRNLRWLVDHLQANHAYYLLGELYVDADKVVNVTDLEVYHPLVWNGVKIKLHYATVGELADYLAFTAIRGEVVVQYWLKQGDESVVLDFGGGGDVVEVPGVLGGL